MKSKIPLFLGIANALSLTCASAAIGLIDDFSGNLSAYTLTKVLDQNAGTSNVGFAISGGRLVVNSAGTTGAEQVLFLRDDRPLGIGEMLTVDVTNSGNWDRDLGLAISTTTSLSGLGNPQAGDTRGTMSYFEVAVRGNDQLMTFTNNPGGAFHQTNTQNFIAASTITSLFIERSSATSFTAGYFVGTTRNDAVSREFLSDSLGNAVGFFADVRTDIASSPTSFDNLQIIPEPSAALLGLMGAAGLLRRRR